MIHAQISMDYNSEKRKRTSSNTENLSLDTTRLPRVLLQTFVSCGLRENERETTKREVGDEEEDVELSLGLSLGGRFGVDKSCKKLKRSTSIASCLPIVRADDALALPAMGYRALVRTSSAPVETEEEWRKRKELQTLRRMVAKRRRSEKRSILKGEKEGRGGGSEERREFEVDWTERLEMLAARRSRSSASSPLTSTASSGKVTSLDQGIDLASTRGKANNVGGNGGGLAQVLSQGSLESRGSSSRMSELEGKALQESNSCNPSPITNSGPSAAKTQEKEPASGTPGTDLQSPCKRADDASRHSGNKDSGANAMEDMPCVFTIGDGPNRRRVDGILYNYGKGEEVRIMCARHGSFLSPAEFVEHAGGSDVALPLKHIVIDPSPPSFR